MHAASKRMLGDLIACLVHACASMQGKDKISPCVCVHAVCLCVHAIIHSAACLDSNFFWLNLDLAIFCKSENLENLSVYSAVDTFGRNTEEVFVFVQQWLCFCTTMVIYLFINFSSFLMIK